MERFLWKEGNTTLPADSQQMITNAAQAAGVGAMAGISLAQMFSAQPRPRPWWALAWAACLAL